MIKAHINEANVIQPYMQQQPIKKKKKCPWKGDTLHFEFKDKDI